jgi:hypothetical protein
MILAVNGIDKGKSPREYESLAKVPEVSITPG